MKYGEGYARYARGHLPPPDMSRRYHRNYTVSENETILTFAARGWSDARIAKRLGRTKRGIARQRWLLEKRASTTLQTADLVRIFGVSNDTLISWQRFGWLPRRFFRRTFHYTEADVEEFIQIREAWPCWWPDRMGDDYWRHRAEEIRPKLLPLADAAKTLFVCERSLQRFAAKGEVAAFKSRGWPGGKWYLPESEIDKLKERYGIAS